MSINDEKLNSQSNPPPVPDVWSPPIEGLKPPPTFSERKQRQPIGDPPPKADEKVELPSKADDEKDTEGN